MLEEVSGHEEIVGVRDPDEVAAWNEAHGQAWRRRWEDLGTQAYRDHALNWFHAFGHLPADRRYARLLAFGGADGQEVLPILDRVDHVTVIDPGTSRLCEQLVRRGAELINSGGDDHLAGRPGAYNVVTCFGVLAALLDPPAILDLLVPCLAPGGFLLLSDSIVAMGAAEPESPTLGRYWRGMPLSALDDLIRQTGLALRHRALCNFALSKFMGPERFNSDAAVRFDAALSRMFSWNVHYRASGLWRRLRPRTVVYVLQKEVSWRACEDDDVGARSPIGA